MKSKSLPRWVPLLILVVAIGGTLAYLIYVNRQSQNDSLKASGTVEAVNVDIAAEIGGRVAAVLVEEGQHVNQGEALLQIDDSLYLAQQERAQAALALAQANLQTANAAVESAHAGLAAAQSQYEQTLNAARAQSLQERMQAWDQSQPDEIDTPVWYFVKEEEIAAARQESEKAQQALADEQVYFNQLSASLNTTDFTAAETRLADAQAAFQVASDVLDLADAQPDAELKRIAQDLYDAALADLDAAQTQYDRLLTEKTAQDVSEARARLAVAQQRYDIAQDHLNALLTGEDSPAVQTAAAAVAQAQAGVTQAEAVAEQAQRSIDQAQAELDLIAVQISKLTLYAPMEGVVMTSSVEPGEVIQPSAAVMTLGQLDDLTITVYIAEDRYGDIFLGQHASVTADPFPGQQFDAVVIRIADQAEYTPRNVQTETGRRTTVFAIKLSVQGPQGQDLHSRLKPGMPADVSFEE